MELVNYYLLLVFAPVLIVVGVLGFVIPKEKSLTSGATAYNIFHIISGIVGLFCLFTGSDIFIRSFNIVFGLIDLYQAAASYLHLFPEKYFRWTRVDDLLHIVVGILLVAVGWFA